jgi:hypothetical protein
MQVLILIEPKKAEGYRATAGSPLRPCGSTYRG